MFLQSLASGLVFMLGLAGLRAAVVRESWALLVVALGVAALGLCWLVLGNVDGGRDGGRVHRPASR